MLRFHLQIGIIKIKYKKRNIFYFSLGIAIIPNESISLMIRYVSHIHHAFLRNIFSPCWKKGKVDEHSQKTSNLRGTI